MPEISLDLGDAAELAVTLTFLADWLSGSQKQALGESLAIFVGHPHGHLRWPGSGDVLLCRLALALIIRNFNCSLS